MVGCKGPTSKVGFCFCCDHQGLSGLYPGTSACYFHSAIRCMPMDHPYREMFATEFEKLPQLAAIAQLGPPNLMTTREAVASARRVEDGPARLLASEPYKFESVWYTNFRQDFVNRTTADVSHEISHGMEDQFCLVLNIQGHQMTFKEAQQEYEQNELGRWPGVKNNQSSRYPWRSSTKCNQRVNLLFQVLKKHYQWHRIKHLAAKPNVGRVRINM